MPKGMGVFDWLTNFFAFLAGVLVIAMMLLISYEVVMRYFLHRAPAWAIEVSEHMVFVLAFLGAAWLLKQGGHVRIEIVTSRLNPKAGALLNVATSALGVLIWLAIAWYAGETTWDHFQRGILIYKALSFPKFILFAFISVGSLLFSFEFLRQTYAYIRKWKVIMQG